MIFTWINYYHDSLQMVIFLIIYLLNVNGGCFSSPIYIFAYIIHLFSLIISLLFG
jgi:hypothetical protein